MNYKKFLGAASAALMIVIVITLALAPDAWAASKYKVLYRFHGAAGAYPGGAYPSSSLIFDKAGNLYGTTTDGGDCYPCGTVFELTPNLDGSWTESVLHSFNGSDGAYPAAGLIFDAGGNLYGTTYLGGQFLCGGSGCGVVFKLAPNQDGSWTESVLHSFNNRDGATPSSRLIFDKAGNLYGMTTDGGGAHGVGTVFKLAPNQDGSWTESVLHSFNGSDGASPAAGLIFDAGGNLYGTTYSGGQLLCGGSGCGVVFRLAPNQDGSWTESVLHSFNGSDGAQPFAGLIFDAAGNLYGTTDGGGQLSLCKGSGCGVVFRLAPNQDGSWTESVLHSFNGSDGAYPAAGLIFDAGGNLYGTTYLGGQLLCGGSGCGVVFKLAPNLDGSWAYSLIHVFKGKPAEYPADGLVLGSAGTLYGTTVDCTMGWDEGCRGVVYQITP
jgi:uncharacterized repeat protein (TIGR03803 family)